MDKFVIYGAVVALVVIALLGVALLGGSKTGTSVSAGGGVRTITQPNSSQSAPLFSSEPYYSSSYLIAPGNLSQQSRTALDGYNMVVDRLANGYENITLSVGGTKASGVLALSPGSKLYIVETSFGDDGPGYDGSLADDGFVVVNQNGYVVNTFTV